MDFNYAALALAILKGYTPEQAFRAMEQPYDRVFRKIYTTQDAEDMTKLKQVYSYREIGRIYNLSRGDVCKRIKRYIKKAPCKASRIS